VGGGREGWGSKIKHTECGGLVVSINLGALQVGYLDHINHTSARYTNPVQVQYQAGRTRTAVWEGIGKRSYLKPPPLATARRTGRGDWLRREPWAPGADRGAKSVRLGGRGRARGGG
jgi:hypothetical protein